MTLITKIYEEYKIPPPLQMHQLRVAGVASILCDSATVEVDKNSVIKACLLHDMGNIIKFNFERQPKGAELDNLEHWREVKQEYIEKYGANEHDATYNIAKELGVSERIIELIDCGGFSRVCRTAENADYNIKITGYSDGRVSPQGVVSLKERLYDGQKRYEHVYKAVGDSERKERQNKCFHELEKQVFENQVIEPEDITDEVINERIRDLKEVKI